VSTIVLVCSIWFWSRYRLRFYFAFCFSLVGGEIFFLAQDNHISTSGGVKKALENVQAYLKKVAEKEEKKSKKSSVIPIVVEARTIDEVKECLKIGIMDRILLDNMIKFDSKTGQVEASKLKEAVAVIKEYNQTSKKKIATEASGNISIKTARAAAECGVDFISCGGLTHSVTALDISLKIRQSSSSNYISYSKL
jgi:nicotinate-nucleotide pyrophosphorylase (carboxylating)